MTETTNNSGDAAAILAAAQRFGEHDLVRIEGVDITVPAVVLPLGKTLTSVKKLVDEWRERPERITSTATLLTIDSLVDYVSRFKRPETALFVSDDPGAPKAVAAIDFHGIGAAAEPSFVSHRATYQFPLSEQAKAWIAIGKGLLNQEEFANFLDDHGYDISNPPADWMMLQPQDLALILDLLNLKDDLGEVDDAADQLARKLESDDGEEDDRYIGRSAVYKLRKIRWGKHDRISALARGVSIAVGQQVKQSFNPRTGEREAVFTETHQDARDAVGRKVVIPDGFFISIPVFEGGERHLLPVRISYRIGGGKALFGLEVVDVRRVVRSAIQLAAADIAKRAGVPLFFGVTQ